MHEATTGSLRVLLFASLRDQAGWGERLMTLPSGVPRPAAVDIWNLLALGPLPAEVRVAINQKLVDKHQPVSVGDEVAFLPPFTGG
ncbi:MoaD/ThiS family protein [cyanobiont of Ornithocercus magnificus]|nr:MoaD/ThiS family protein [cyanobiont of Ornithocercus magnificus]